MNKKITGIKIKMLPNILKMLLKNLKILIKIPKTNILGVKQKLKINY